MPVDDSERQILTSEYVLVYPRKLDVRFWGIRYNQAVHDTFRDRLGDSMAKEILDLYSSSIGCLGTEFRRIIIEHVCQCSVADCVERYRR